MTPKAYGQQSEDLATTFLEQNGFRIIERNYFARKMGEIDIIATRDDVWHFIEVKSSQTSYDAIYNIRPSKIKKVIKSSQYYMKTKGLDVVFSIDAIVIRGKEIEFLENITM